MATGLPGRPGRSVDELMMLHPQDMTWEEQQLLYQTLYNALVGTAMGGGQGVKVPPPGTPYMAPREDIAWFLQPPAPAANLTSLMQQYAARRAAMPKAQTVPVTRAERLRDILKRTGQDLAGRAKGMAQYLDPLNAADSLASLILGDKPSNPAEAVDAANGKKASPAQPTPTTAAEAVAKRINPLSARTEHGRTIFGNTKEYDNTESGRAQAEAAYQIGLADWQAKDAARKPLELPSNIAPTAGRQYGPLKTGTTPGLAMEPALPNPPGAPAGWDAMAPGAKEAYLGDVGRAGAAAQTSLGVQEKAAQVRDLEDPTMALFRGANALDARGQEAAAGSPEVELIVQKAKKAQELKGIPFDSTSEALVRKKAADEIARKETLRQEDLLIGADTKASALVKSRGLIPQ